jgi:DNA polymerase-1
MKHDLIISIDWAQEELLLLAGQSKDANLLSCYTCDPFKDVHSMTTAPFAGLTYEQFELARKVDEALDSMRTVKGKGTNFGSIYGIGKAKLSRGLLIPEEEAAAWIATFDATYPGVKTWKQAVIELLRRQGYVEDLLGVRRHIYDRPQRVSDNEAAMIDRQVISFMIQGLAAGILKRTLAKLHRQRTFKKYGASFISPIYDEVVSSSSHEAGFDLISEIHEAMVMPVPGLGLDMKADISIGPNFGTQYEIGRYPDREKYLEAVETIKEKRAECKQ